MSHNGPPQEKKDQWASGSLDLTVETLMGTTFEIKVSPSDTVTSLKNKIQSVEGIPASQQHLLYNMQELDDTKSIRDHSIPNGATLKLVTSMRVGPISTKRAPEVDELAWRELQELMSDTPKDDLYDRLPPGTRLTVLIFQDGDQVNFLKVLENEDGTFSPLSDAWNGSSLRTLFSRGNAEESDERLEENSVTMGKVQELKERLEALSIQKKDKKTDEPSEGEAGTSTGSRRGDGRANNPRSVRVVSYLTGGLQSQSNSSRMYRRSQREIEASDSYRPRSLLPSLFSYPRLSITGMSRVRKEAEKIIRMQSKLSVLVDSESSPGYGLKRPPLPEIRRSPPAEKEKVESQDEKLDDNVREKTATSFAIVEEENDVSPAPICSSQSSVVALPSSEEVTAAVALSPMSSDRVSPTVNRSIYKVSSYVVENEERPKTTPAKPETRKGAKTEPPKAAANESESSAPAKRVNPYSRLLKRLTRMVPVTKVIAIENGKERELKPEEYAAPATRNPPTEEDPAQQPAAKKRLRCTKCKKKLNITNTYNCRCGGPFCAVHRYSEVHDCPIDYRRQGRRIIRQMNPLIAPPKLPKI